MPDSLATTSNQPVILLAGDRFFVRRISLVANSPIAPQIELALETLSPFPLEQLFYGYLVDYKRQHALVYAAYRRSFTAEEQMTWENARTVLPEFVLWGIAPRRSRAGTGSLRASEHVIEAVAWDEASELPGLILTRQVTPETTRALEAELLRDLKTRSGLADDQINAFHGDISATGLIKGNLQLVLGDADRATLPAAALGQADIRDKTLLTLRQAEHRRTTLLWRIFATTAAALVLCLLVEAGLFGGRILIKNQQSKLDARAPEVQQIESAQLLATKLQKMTVQQSRPFEMLAAINRPRPASVEFLRVSTNGPLQLSIEAQTGEAGDLRTYEDALKTIPGIDKVELRDPRMRAGRTSFQLEVSFKPNWFQTGGGA
jgi:hypothetical protein